jgi:hypothetical protein
LRIIVWAVFAGVIIAALVVAPSTHGDNPLLVLAAVLVLATVVQTRRCVDRRAVQLDSDGFTVHRGWPAEPNRVPWRDTLGFWAAYDRWAGSQTDYVAYRLRGSTAPIGTKPDGDLYGLVGGFTARDLADYLTEWRETYVPDELDAALPSDVVLCPKCRGHAEYQWPGEDGAFYRCVGCKDRFQVKSSNSR